jgi:transposase-like protein
MAKSVKRRAKTCKRRPLARKQRRERQRQLQEQIDAILPDLLRQTLENALQEEVTALLGREKSVRRDLADWTEVEARCNRCQACYRAQFYRDGFYSRSLLTFEAWVQLKVPRLRCVCGGVVDFSSAYLEPYARLWFDLEERARELAGLCLSLRDSVAVLSWRNHQPLAISTLNQRVVQAADLAPAFHTGEFTRVPAVLMLDGIWLKLLVPTEEEYVDRKGRHRKRMKLRKYPVLVAYGVDPTSGERWILDWERGEEEDQASWQRLLERLWERGVRAERGLRLVVHDGGAGLARALEMVTFGPEVADQRCIFHKLQNVRRDVQGTPEMSRDERRAHRQAVLHDATAVYQGHEEAAIRARLAAFGAKWAPSEPKAVATLERDFDRTLAYLRVQEQARRDGQEWRRECLRTTSPLERVQRQFRQRARQVMVAHSEKGAEANLELVIYRRHLASPTADALSWTQRLEQALLAA